MTKINYHPADDVLLKYVSGHYDTAYNIVLASHVSQCLNCQNAVALHQEIGGHTLREQEPAKMNVSAMDLLDKDLLDKNSRDIVKPAIKEVARTLDDQSETFGIKTPGILTTYLGKALDALKWQSLSPSLKQYVIEADGKAVARLLWMAPGKAVPPHGHQGEEMTLILSGGYYDGDEAFTAGDLHIADHKTPHVPVAMEDKPCLVLTATDAPLIFKGIIPKLLQPFYKI